MSRAELLRRLRAAERARAKVRAKANRAPFGVVVNWLAGGTRGQALEAFYARWGKDRHRCLLVTPAKPNSPEQQAEYAMRFREQQRRLVAEARSVSREVVAATRSAPSAVSLTAIFAGKTLKRKSNRPKPWVPPTR